LTSEPDKAGGSKIEILSGEDFQFPRSTEAAREDQERKA